MTSPEVASRRLAGKTALVTGASGALGSAVARALGREGASVAICYYGSQTAAAGVLADLRKAGERGHLAHLDVRDTASVTAAVRDAVARYGRLDVVINAAGCLDGEVFQRLPRTDEHALRKILDVDLLGTWRVCMAAAKELAERGDGSIINFTSSYGNGVKPENAVTSLAPAYYAAKTGIRGLTRAVAREMFPDVRVNAIAPGPIAPRDWAERGLDWEHLGITRADLEEASAMIPLRRMGYPEEIAETAVFLASPAARSVSGREIEVSGGSIVAR